MRRPTLNPNNIKISAKPSQNIPRLSIQANNTSLRRDPRQIRDKQYIAQCIQTIENFLINNNFNITAKTLTNPSVKDVQTIFKFIYSFIDDLFEYTSRFEDDVLGILKLIKYPYISEINRSQFIAITPHSWPVILSMFTWIVEQISYIESVKSTQTINVNSLFSDHILLGYQHFLQGEDEMPDEELEHKIKELHKDFFRDIDDRVELLKQIEDKYSNVEWNQEKERMEILINRRNKNNNDRQNLIKNMKQLEDKKKKYEMKNLHLKNTISDLDVELNEYKIKINDFKHKINLQPIKPEEFKEINEEKIELYNKLEKFKPIKEKYYKDINELDKINNDKFEALEKLLFDLKNIRKQNIPFKILKDKDSFRMEGNNENFTKEIETEIFSVREKIYELEEQYNILQNRKDEVSSAANTKIDSIKFKDEKFITLGKLYLEKKEQSEMDQRRNWSELNKLENEIMKLNLEDNHKLLMSNKQIEIKKIERERVINHISVEKKEIEKEILELKDFCLVMEKEIEKLVKNSE